MAARDLELDEFALSRRIRGNSVKVQKCPRNSNGGRRRTSRSKSRDIQKKETGKHGRGRHSEGLSKQTLDVQRIINDLTDVKEALCQNNRQAGRSNRKCDKIFGEVMESILCAFQDSSKRSHEIENGDGFSLATDANYPEDSQDLTSDSTCQNFKGRTNFADRNLNVEDPKTRLSRNPYVWKPKKNFEVLEESSIEEQIQSSRNFSSESSRIDTSEDLKNFEGSNIYLASFHQPSVGKHFKLQDMMNQHDKNHRLNDFGDGDSIKLGQGNHIFSDFESAMRRNSGDQRCRKTKGKHVLIDNQGKDHCSTHQLVDYQGRTQRTRGKRREAAKVDTCERHICPTCVCITKQRGRKSELKREHKAGARRFTEPDFDDQFRFLEKGTGDLSSPDEWWKLERDYGHRLHPHKTLPKNHAPVNSGFERKVRQVSTTVSNNNACEPDCLDSYRLHELREKPSKVKISKCIKTSGSNTSLGNDMRKFVKEFCIDSLNPIREKQKILPKKQQFDYELNGVPHRANRTEANYQKRKNHLASYDVIPQGYQGFEESFLDDIDIKYHLNNNPRGQSTNRRKITQKKTPPKENSTQDNLLESIEINNELKPKSVEKGQPKSPKKRFRIHHSKKTCDEYLDEINPKPSSVFLKNLLSPNHQLSSEVKPVDDFINNLIGKKEKNTPMKKKLHLKECEVLPELSEVVNYKKGNEDSLYEQIPINKKKKIIGNCKQSNTEKKLKLNTEMKDINHINKPLPNELANTTGEFEVHGKNSELEKLSFSDNLVNKFPLNELPDMQSQDPQSKIHEPYLESEKVNQSDPDNILELDLMYFEDQESNIETDNNKDEVQCKENSPPKVKPVFVPKNKLSPVAESKPRNIDNKAAIENVREPLTNSHKKASLKEKEALSDIEESCPVIDSRIDDRDVQESVWDKVKRWDEGCRQKNENGPKSVVSSVTSTRDILKKFNSGSDMASMLYGSPPKTFYPPQCDYSGADSGPNHQRQHWKIPPQSEMASNKNIVLDNNESNQNCMEFGQRLTQPISNQLNLKPSHQTEIDQEDLLEMDPYSRHVTSNQTHMAHPLQPTNNIVRMNMPYQMYGGYGNFPFFNPSLFPYYANPVGMLRPNMFMPRAGCNSLETNSIPPFPNHSSTNDNDPVFHPKNIGDPYICKQSEFNQNNSHDVNNPECDPSNQFSDNASPNRTGVDRGHVQHQAQNFMGKCTNGDAYASARINKKFNESHQAFNCPTNTSDADTTPPRYAGAAVSYSSKLQPLNKIQTSNLPRYFNEAFQDNSTTRQDLLCFQPLYEGTSVNHSSDLLDMHKSNSKRDIPYCQTRNEDSSMSRPKDSSEGNQEKSNSKLEIMSSQDRNEGSSMNRARDLSEVIRDKSTSGRDMKRVLYGAEDGQCSKLQMKTPVRGSTGSVRPSDCPPVSNEASPAAIGSEFSRLKLQPDGSGRRGDSNRRPQGIVPCLDNVSFS